MGAVRTGRLFGIRGTALAAAVLSVALPAQADLLKTSRSRDALSSVLGGPPTSCYPAGDRLRLCTWRIDGPLPAALKEAAPRGPWHVLCELPYGGAERAPGSCTTHSPMSFTRSRGNRRVSSPPGKAKDQLEAARTLSEISRLIGSGPTDCASSSLDAWTCLWNVTPANQGYRLLQRLLAPDARTRWHTVPLLCRLPVDGKPREADSCHLVDRTR